MLAVSPRTYFLRNVFSSGAFRLVKKSGKLGRNFFREKAIHFFTQPGIARSALPDGKSWLLWAWGSFLETPDNFPGPVSTFSSSFICQQ